MGYTKRWQFIQSNRLLFEEIKASLGTVLFLQESCWGGICRGVGWEVDSTQPLLDCLGLLSIGGIDSLEFFAKLKLGFVWNFSARKIVDE